MRDVMGALDELFIEEHHLQEMGIEEAHKLIKKLEEATEEEWDSKEFQEEVIVQAGESLAKKGAKMREVNVVKTRETSPASQKTARVLIATGDAGKKAGVGFWAALKVIGRYTDDTLYETRHQLAKRKNS